MNDYKENVIPHDHHVKKRDREKSYGHKAKVIWFVGLSGSGKSTLASALEHYLHTKGYKTYILDGDNVRSGLNTDLDFSEEARKENIRRISEVSKLFVDAGTIVLTAFITPFHADREKAKNLVGAENYYEVYIDCPLEVCESRDVKGLYKKAREGKIKDFTGISSPFEIPNHADISLDTANNSLETCLIQLINDIEPKVVL